MSLSIGIVGLPNVGKSTLFNAILKREAALAANYPFATIEPNIGVVDVPDERLAGLVKVVQAEFGSKNRDKDIPEKVIPAVVKFYDIAGLVAGAHKGEGLGNQFLSHIREASAIVQVVRAFTDENVIRAGAVSPEKDIELINTELMLADMQTLDKRLEFRRAKEDFPVLTKIKEHLEKGIMVSQIELTDEEKEVIKELNFLTQKPIFYVLNTDEDAIKDDSLDNIANGALRVVLAGDRARYIKISAKVESELSSFSEEERKAYLEDLGVKESGLDKVIKESFSILGLQTFLTAGPKEVRAWTIRKGAKAPEAAGVIHTDFEKGFIRAEIVSYDDLVAYGGWKAAKEKGLLRSEGKEYVMKDGDVVEFRFNV